MKKWLATSLCLLLSVWAASAFAQSNPGFTYGQVPTAAQWNNAFSAKQDVLPYKPLNRGGDSMTGKLSTTASTAQSAGFSFAQGVAPSAPQNGDTWLTSLGLYVQVNGATVGPLTDNSHISVINPSFPGTINNMVIGGTTPLAGTFTNLNATSFVTTNSTVNSLLTATNLTVPGTVSFTNPLAVASGGTGSTTASGARTNLGLGTAAVQNIGTSGANVPLLNGTNTWIGVQIVPGI
ncbi:MULTISPECIES: hypothetical protein, partial [unclassified Rhizobium]|uniref:hypothetical protein n=1 Tax=unclassified Rhizobium TaxID=2613769 RepID=UPI003808BE0A